MRWLAKSSCGNAITLKVPLLIGDPCDANIDIDIINMRVSAMLNTEGKNHVQTSRHDCNS